MTRTLIAVLALVSVASGQVTLREGDLSPASEIAWDTDDLGLIRTMTLELLAEETPWARANSFHIDTQKDGFGGDVGSPTNDILVFGGVDGIGAVTIVSIPADANLSLHNDIDDGSGKQGSGPNGVLDTVDAYVNSDPIHNLTGISDRQFLKYYLAEPGVTYMFESPSGETSPLGSGYVAFIFIDDDHTGPNLDFNDMIVGIRAECRPEQICPPLDVVFIMDTSGSMQEEGEALCDTIDGVIGDLAAQGIVVEHNILAIDPIHFWDLFSCQSRGDSVSDLLGNSVPGDPDGCPGNLTGHYNHNRDENWGPATAIVADRFPWTHGAVRVIIPISDEGPCLGSSCNGCNDPGSDRDAVSNAIAVAVANDVIVSPITGDGSSLCVIRLSEDLAAGTGGDGLSVHQPEFGYGTGYRRHHP